MIARYDFIVIGGGIAAVCVAYELAAHGSVCLLEQEQQLAYHATGSDPDRRQRFERQLHFSVDSSKNQPPVLPHHMTAPLAEALIQGITP
ncbi:MULTISPECIES: FAD-dependent oxidoreductase [unclassified Pseudomonas]|uniref:FAD-dependent oxidoreductase n=1 Tax=unclassified Pseudomonas TaxID=196821 RepID=UPI0039B75DAF